MPTMQPIVDDVAGTGAAMQVFTVANGIAPAKGTVSLVVSGVPGEVRKTCCYLTTARFSGSCVLRPH